MLESIAPQTVNPLEIYLPDPLSQFYSENYPLLGSDGLVENVP